VAGHGTITVTITVPTDTAAIIVWQARAVLLRAAD
jgi:hypothetical protein